MSTHTHTHTHRHNLRREESPTRTGGLQDEYRVELERRFRRLRGVIRETIDANDALELRDRQNAADDIDARSEFNFTQAPRKQAAFQNQLGEWLNQGIVEPAGPQAVADGSHWTATYVRASYREGIQWAEQQLREAGATVPDRELEQAFNAPIHTDQLEALYTRNFSELQGITDDVDRQLGRLLAEGLRDGENPRTIANRLTEQVRIVQRRDARRIARTEILHSHNAAAGRRYQEHGVEQVEILTHDPCPVCERIEANDPYPAAEAHALVPNRTHPQCVCTVVPVIS